MEENKEIGLGWIFIVLLLFFGIFGGNGGGLFGGNKNNGDGGIADMLTLKALQTSGNGCAPCQTDRDVLELKCSMVSQNALLNQSLDTAFRTILTSQDAGFAAAREQTLNDQIRARDMTLMAQNSEIQSLKTGVIFESRMNALERMVEQGFCQTVKKPPFFPYGCTPCSAGTPPTMA